MEQCLSFQQKMRYPPPPLWSGESPLCSHLKGPRRNGETLRERWECGLIHACTCLAHGHHGKMNHFYIITHLSIQEIAKDCACFVCTCMCALCSMCVQTNCFELAACCVHSCIRKLNTCLHVGIIASPKCDV